MHQERRYISDNRIDLIKVFLYIYIYIYYGRKRKEEKYYV